MTCAYYLARLGYHVDVYEAENRPGGIMTYGIPDYRLPLNIIEREIENIKKTGVNIILNTKIGVDVSFRSLQKNYDAIFIAIGAQKTLQLGIPGEDLEGVYHGLDFLKRVILQRDLDTTPSGSTAPLGSMRSRMPREHRTAQKNAFFCTRSRSTRPPSTTMTG